MRGRFRSRTDRLPSNRRGNRKEPLPSCARGTCGSPVGHWPTSSFDDVALVLVGAVVLVLLARRLVHRKPTWSAHPSKWTAGMIASGDFLRTPQWKRARYDALLANDGRCELCARDKHQLGQGRYLNVDHVKPRRARPDLALDVRNLQVLCADCNAGKGNRSSDDWRHPSHPHRKR